MLYSYDPWGNILEKVIYALTVEGEPEDPTETVWNFFCKETIHGGTQRQKEPGAIAGWKFGTDFKELQQGDLIYWMPKTRDGIGHVGIYDADGYMYDNSPKLNITRRKYTDAATTKYDMMWMHPNY